MNPIILLRSLALLILSTSLLRADLTRTEVSKTGEWTVNACKDAEGKFIHTEMVRTYDGKQEVHLRIIFNGDAFHIDSSADWSQLPDAKSYAAEYRINTPTGEPGWKGKATVIEEADGQPWLRITEPNEPGVGDGVANADKIFIKMGKVQWAFDLKGSNRAYKAMIDSYMAQESTKQASGNPALKQDTAATELIEHDYARPGDWGVHYFTDSKGKFVQASMIRYYDNDQMLRLTIDDKNTHLDVSGNWAKLDAATGGKKTGIPLQLATEPNDDGIDENASIIDDEGDKWLRITQSPADPGGMTDGVRNGKMIILKVKTKALWTFDLTGSHAAWQKVDECLAKFRK